ncbi:MAG TPA: SpvB/TcaC N-terminal domain-containing protein, partial [Myxococcales bacterium]|nr:SpvB/TcaC N-terminal domain-containing protein [Myxococcales bacterium]
MQNRRHLVVLAVTAALFGSSACKEGAAPNPLPTIRLTPASVQADSAIDAARLSDRDTATPLLLDGRRVVSFHFDHVVELRKVKVFGSGVRVAVLQPGEKMLGAQPQLAELEMGAQDAWSAASLSPLVSGSDVAVSLSPLRAGARVAEVELWGAGLPTAPRQIQPVAEASSDPKAAQYENLRIVRGEPASATLEPANSAGNCLRSRFAAAGSLAAHSARRAYLVYEANVQRPTALKRSLDGEAPVGGFWLASTDEARTLVDEIDPERLRGQDAVALCLPADATGPVSVHGLRLLLQLDDGVDVFDRDSHARFAAALDGDRSTSHSLHGERSEVGFDRPFAIERAALHLGSAPAQLVSLGGFDGRAWNEMGGRSLGEQTTDLALGDRTLQSVALTFAGRARPDVPAATLAELELAGSGVGPRVAVPRIVITSPALRFDGGQTIGERFGDRAYIAGWAESPAGAGSVEIDGAPAGVDGAFGPALRRRAGSSGTWDAVVRARFPDGTELTRAIRFGDDHQDEIDAGSSSAKSDGSEAMRYGRRNQSAWNLLDPKKGGKVDLGSEIELDVPEGAVNAKVIAGVTRKGVEATPRLDAGMINVTAPGRAAYRFLPKGQKFLKPVNVTLPYDPALLPDGVGPEQIKTYFFDPKKDRWIALPRAALAPGRVVSQTTHFTFMINAVLVLPDHPGPTSFNPTSIKDLKAADPSAGIDLVEPPQGNNQGTAQLSFPMRLPKARGAYQPSLRLAYDSGGGSGWLGVGWDLKASSVQVDTRFGVPYYDGREHYVLDGAQLVPQDGTSVDQRCVDGSDGRRYVARVERDFQRIVRCGAGPSTYRFEVTDRSGTLFVYGATDATRLSSARPTGEIGEWFIERVVDLNGNLTLFSYDLDVREAPVAFQDAAQGGLVHNEQFRQLYLRSIEYSGSAPRTGASALTAVTAPGPYRVELRSQQVGGSHLARSDTLTSARFGFKVVTRRLLESVRVRVAESGAARGIREYRMDYQRGSFGKSRLAGVGVYGAWEGERGSGPFFYRHAFEYTDAPDQDGAKPFGGDTGPVAWKFDDGADDEPISRSEMSGFGVHGYVGIGLGPTRFNGSAGIRVGFSKHDSNTTSTIADLNGDGLPDRVRLRPRGADVRFNQAFDGSAGHMSRVAPPSDPFAGRPLANVPLPTLGSESGSSRNIAAQATFGPIGVNVGKTFFSSTTPEYMIDADGDGLVDVLTRGTILFNQPRNGALLPDCVASDPSTFCFNPAKWVRSIGAPHPAEGFVGTNPSDAPADDPGGLDPDVNPSDALLEWLAPYNGNVDVSGMLSFVNRPSGASDPRWDGVRLRIYRVTPIQGPTPYRTDLLAEVRKTLTDPPAATPVSLSYV